MNHSHVPLDSSSQSTEAEDVITEPNSSSRASSDFTQAISIREHTPEDESRGFMLPSLASQWADFVPDIVAIITALLFWALAISIIALNNRPVEHNPWGKRVADASQLAPTIWPIVFAATLGNAAKGYAQWKAERGSRLGDLEQLMGSQTFFSSITSAFTFRKIGILPAVLLTSWCFGPLGSQASLRSLTTSRESGTELRNISYLNTAKDPETTDLRNAGGTRRTAQVAVYSAALLSRDGALQYSNGSSDDFASILSDLGAKPDVFRTSSSDIWGNVRIPKLEVLPAFNPYNPHDWVKVPYTDQIINYSSLIGIPIRERVHEGQGALSSVGNMTFLLHSNYLTMKCEPWLNINFTSQVGLQQWGLWYNNTFTKLTARIYDDTDLIEDHLASICLPSDLFRLGFCDPDYNISSTSPPTVWSTGFFVDTIGDPDIQSVRTLVFGSRYTDYHNEGMWTTQCLTSTTFVISNVSCQNAEASKTHCVVQSMRMDPDPTWSPTKTFLGEIYAQYDILRDFPIATDDPEDFPEDQSTTQEWWLQDPSSLSNSLALRSLGYKSRVSLGRVPIGIFQQRLAMLLNTFWRASVCIGTILGGEIPTNNTGPTAPADIEAPIDPLSNPMANITASLQYWKDPVYALNTPWVVLFCIADIILLTAAFIGFFFKLQCRGPAIFGVVSSLTRDSPYFSKSIQIGSPLAVSKRSRALFDLRVRLEDVKSESSIGRISFAEENRGEGLRRRRLYE